MTKSEKITLVILLGSVAAIGPFTTDMYLPGFPSIAKDFGVSEAEISYTLTGYFIGISIGQLFYGPLIDRYGRKKPLLIGLFIYVLASVACFLVSNLYIFIALRFLQALGASAGMVAGTAMVRDLFDSTEVARTLSSILLVMGVAPIIAPSLGGFLLRAFNWEAIFIFLSSISFILAINIYFFLGETRGFHSESTLCIKTILLNYWQELKNKKFTNFSLAGSLAMAIMYAYIASISYILMTIYGVSNTTFGWLFAINAIGYVGGSQLNNYLLKKKNLYKLTRYMNLIQVMISIVFLILAYSIKLPLTFFCLLIFSVLFILGFLNPNSTALSLATVIDKNVGMASALNGSMRMGAGALVSFSMGKFSDGTMLPLLWCIFILTSVSYALLLKTRK